jgi:hypothetical protein
MLVAETTLSSEAKKELATLIVAALYASFDVAMLEAILTVGRQYHSDREEVQFMNEALTELIEQRKAGQCK